MIARLEVTRGTLTEYPLAERTKNGWQNGVTFYPDDEVTKVTPLRVVPANSQGEPSDAQVNAAAKVFWDLMTREAPIDAMRAALRAAGGVR